MMHKFTKKRLAELWQAEQERRVMILPIAIGDKVYEITRTYNYEDDTAEDWEQQTGFEIKPKEVCGISFNNGDWYVIDKYGEEILLGTEEALYPLEDVQATYEKWTENFNAWVAKGRPKC
jgi:hypothetical protein